MTGGVVKGRIVKGVGGLYFVSAEGKTYCCRARGKFKIDKKTPIVGDMADVSVIGEDGGYIVNLYPRKNELSRPKAANIDLILIVVSAAEPTVNFKALDALIAVCEEAISNEPDDARAEIALCVTKADLIKDGLDWANVYGKLYKTVVTSANDGTGLEELAALLRGKTSVTAGVSGVGKSSLLNALSSVGLATGGLSRKIERGRHTTRHTELFEIFERSFLADTPGFSDVAPEKIPATRLQYCFKEFAPFLGGCKYVNCRHLSEDCCAVKAELGAAVDEGRYERYALLMKGAKR